MRVLLLPSKDNWIDKTDLDFTATDTLCSNLSAVADKISCRSVRKSKAADEERKHKARRARAEYHRQSLRAIQKGKVAGLSNLFQNTALDNGQETTQGNCSISPIKLQITAENIWERPARPISREVIIRWFKEEQIPLRAGMEKDNKQIAAWFHDTWLERSWQLWNLFYVYIKWYLGSKAL